MEVLEEAEPAGRLYQDEHPMLNPLVIQKVLNFAKPSFTTLKSLRQVSRVWHDLTLPLWRSQATLLLITPPGIFLKPKKGLNFTEFLDRLENPQDPYSLGGPHHFKRYKLVQVDIDMSLMSEPGPCQTFWNLVAPFMEYLHLEHCTFPKTPKDQINQLVFQTLPNLKHLVITETNRNPTRSPLVNNGPSPAIELTHDNLKTAEFYGSTPYTHQSFNLLNHLPDLEHLTLRNGSVKSYGNCIPVLSALTMLSRDNPSKLKSLDIMHTNGFVRLGMLPRLLEQWKPPLETLSLELRPDKRYNPWGDPLDNCPLQPFLQHLAGTLKFLKVFQAPLVNDYFCKTDNPFIWEMDKLEELHLWGNVTRSLSLLKYMVNLKKLWISRNCQDKWDHVNKVIGKLHRSAFVSGHGESGRVAIRPLKCDVVLNAVGEGQMIKFWSGNLVDLRIDYLFDKQSLGKMGEWMPRLKKLRLVLDKEAVGTCVELWPGLEEFGGLFGSGQVDDLTLLGWKEEDDDGGDQEEPEHGWLFPGILDLEYLKVFELDALCDQGQLTDLSANLVFGKMKRLESLKICVGPWFSAEAEAFLNQKITHVQIIRNYGPGPHPNYNCCGMTSFLDQVDLLQPLKSCDDNSTSEDDSESESEEEDSDDDWEDTTDDDEDFLRDEGDDPLLLEREIEMFQRRVQQVMIDQMPIGPIPYPERGIQVVMFPPFQPINPPPPPSPPQAIEVDVKEDDSESDEDSEDEDLLDPELANLKLPNLGDLLTVLNRRVEACSGVPQDQNEGDSSSESEEEDVAMNLPNFATLLTEFHQFAKGEVDIPLQEVKNRMGNAASEMLTAIFNFQTDY